MLIMTAISKSMRFRELLLPVLLAFVYSCNFAQSIEKDLETGLTTRGKGLSCEQVYLSDGENVIKRNTFTYGETYFVSFDGMDGFVRENAHAFPDMQLLVVGEQGDTALFVRDMYADYQDGIALDPMVLYAEVTVADPIHSEAQYTLLVNISDKKGEGTFRASLDFTVHKDDRIKLEGEGLRCREIYLFSQQGGHTITDGRTGFNETIYLLVEGLEGLEVQDGQVQMGLSMLVKDAEENVILDEADLFGDHPLNYADVHEQVAPNLVLSGSQIANPVFCTIRIWDKKGRGWISASYELVVE